MRSRPPQQRETIRRGDWLWLCRAGSERDLIEELEACGAKQSSQVTDGVVRSPSRPARRGESIELAFARQGLTVDEVLTSTNAEALGRAAAAALAPRLRAPFALHVIVPDSDGGNLLASQAPLIERALCDDLGRRDPSLATRRVEPQDAPPHAPFAQVCLLDATTAALGILPVGAAVSVAPGGRRRIGAPAGAPSRAAAKLLEAFDWLGRAPDRGDLCVDLGAAPGGWSYVLLGRGARVIAVDPARLAPAVTQHGRRLRHVQASAFEFLPDEPVDWLLCDMAWRPLEVAALLSKWARRGAARFLVANIKLPMKRKVETIARVRHVLVEGGWRDVRIRQLYHDRDEITLGAWRLGR